MTGLVLYAEDADPFVEALRTAASKHLQFLHADQLLAYLRPAPWPSMLELSLPAALAEQFEVTFIVNRCFSLGDSVLGNALQSWGIPERWFHLKLQPYLERAGKCIHDVGLRGVSRSLLPLPTQWFHVQRSSIGVAVPRFAYVMGQELPDLAQFEAPMRKSIWSLFDWKQENHLPLTETRRNAFVVDQPKGVPVIVSYLGEQAADCIFPRETVELDHHTLRRLADIGRNVFHSEMGEILSYVEPSGQMTFCAFSPFMHSCSKSKGFDGAIRRWIETSV